MNKNIYLIILKIFFIFFITISNIIFTNADNNNIIFTNEYIEKIWTEFLWTRDNYLTNKKYLDDFLLLKINNNTFESNDIKNCKESDKYYILNYNYLFLTKTLSKDIPMTDIINISILFSCYNNDLLLYHFEDKNIQDNIKINYYSIDSIYSSLNKKYYSELEVYLENILDKNDYDKYIWNILDEYYKIHEEKYEELKNIRTFLYEDINIKSKEYLIQYNKLLQEIENITNELISKWYNILDIQIISTIIKSEDDNLDKIVKTYIDYKENTENNIWGYKILNEEWKQKYEQDYLQKQLSIINNYKSYNNNNIEQLYQKDNFAKVYNKIFFEWMDWDTYIQNLLYQESFSKWKKVFIYSIMILIILYVSFEYYILKILWNKELLKL